MVLARVRNWLWLRKSWVLGLRKLTANEHGSEMRREDRQMRNRGAKTDGVPVKAILGVKTQSQIVTVKAKASTDGIKRADSSAPVRTDGEIR